MPPRITHPDGEKGAHGEAAAGKVDPHCDGGTGGGGGAADGAARRAARLLCGGLAHWYALGSLVLVPLLAYPVSWALRSGRARQRKLAVLFSLAGYLLLLVLCIAAPVSGAACAVYLTYMLSVLVVALTSRFPKLRASGHACGVSGPLTVLIYLHGLRWLAPGLAVLAAMFWSSITLGRHMLRQLLLGAAAPAVIFLAFAVVGVV